MTAGSAARGGSARWAPALPGRPLAGLGHATAVSLRACWGALAVACVTMPALVTAIATSITALYPTLEERIAYAASAGASTVQAAFNGLPYGLTTLGGITAIEVGFMGQIIFPTVGVLLGVRLTRREEEDGRVELLTASRVGRLAPLGSAALLLIATALVGGAAMTAGMVAAGLPGRGSSWYAASVALCSLFFGAVGLVLAQMCQRARTAQHLGIGVVSAAFLMRFAIDGLQWRAAWASPLGWLPEARAFDGPRLWPLIAYGACAALLTILAAVIAGGRDTGAGIVAPRPGPARGPSRAMPAWRLALGLQRGGAAAWLIGAVVWALVIGLFSDEVTSTVASNPQLLRSIGLERATDMVTMLAAVIIVSAASIVGVQGATRLGGEETSGRLGALLSTRLGRARLWLGWWATTLAACLIVLGASALALAGGIWAVTRDAPAAWAALEVGGAYAAPVLLVAALDALLSAIGPRWSVAGWVVAAWMAVVMLLAEALRLPEWARDLSPAHMVGVLPVDDPDLGVIAVQGAAALILLAASLILFQRRDLRAG